MAKKASQHTAEEICAIIDQAVELAFSFFPPRVETVASDQVLRAAQTVGYDTRRLNMHGLDGVEYLHRRELAFGIGVEVRPSFEWKHDAALRIACPVTWSAGGSQQTAMEAVAAASLHLEAATKAVQLEVALGEVLRAFRGSSAKADRKQWDAAVSLWRKRNQEGLDKLRAELDRLKAESA